MRILVTGGAGFVGKNLIPRLRQGNHEVQIFDALSAQQDIRNYEDVVQVFRFQPQVVFHLAAQTEVNKSILDPLFDFQVNALGTLHVLRCAKEVGAKVIYASTAAVYGDPQYLPIDENHRLQPKSPYGFSKLTGERYCLLYSQLYDLPVTVLRISSVYGPHGHGVVNKFLAQNAARKPITIFGDGTQTRDFIYIEDVVNALLKSIKTDGVFNVGTGRATSINELVHNVEKITGNKGVITHKEPMLGDIKHSWLNIERTVAELGFKPEVELSSGLRRTFEWLKPV